MKKQRYAYLRWIQITKTKKQAILAEEKPKGTDTPEGFYHNEPRHSSLYDRAVARGIVCN